MALARVVRCVRPVLAAAIFLRERHHWRWKDVRRRFTTPTGHWLPVTADEIEFKRIAAILIIRCRYRGSTMPSPWVTQPT